MVVVPGLLDAAVSGLAEYARVLGMRQLNSMDVVPESVQTPCFLSRYAYAPARHLDRGLPVQEWDGAGYRRTLVDFNASTMVSPALFRSSILGLTGLNTPDLWVMSLAPRWQLKA